MRNQELGFRGGTDEMVQMVLQKVCCNANEVLDLYAENRRPFLITMHTEVSDLPLYEGQFVLKHRLNVD